VHAITQRLDEVETLVHRMTGALEEAVERVERRQGSRAAR
jgi:hypothetical protein